MAGPICDGAYGRVLAGAKNSVLSVEHLTSDARRWRDWNSQIAETRPQHVALTGTGQVIQEHVDHARDVLNF
jgi:hypothetical protein